MGPSLGSVLFLLGFFSILHFCYGRSEIASFVGPPYSGSTSCFPGINRCAGPGICGPAYQGTFCIVCAQQYYPAAGECSSCITGAAPAALITVQLLWLCSVACLAVFAQDSLINNLFFFLSTLRMIWAATFDSLAGFASGAQTVLSVVSLFAGDMEFMHLACTGVSAFVNMFAVNVGTFTALFVLVLALLFVLHRCAVAVPARDAAFNPHVTRELHRSFARRAVRALAVVLAFGFEVIWVYCVKAFSCASTPAVLVVDPFQGAHITIFIFALLAALVLCLLPVGLFVCASVRAWWTSDLASSVLGTFAAVFLADVKEQYFWWPSLLIVSVDLVFGILGVAANGILANGYKMTVLFVVALLLVSLRPYVQPHKALIFFVALLCALLSTVTALLEYVGVDAPVPAWAAAVCMCVYAVLVLASIVWFGFAVRVVDQDRLEKLPLWLRPYALFAHAGQGRYSSPMLVRLRGGDARDAVSPFSLPSATGSLGVPEHKQSRYVAPMSASPLPAPVFRVPSARAFPAGRPSGAAMLYRHSHSRLSKSSSPRVLVGAQRPADSSSDSDSEVVPYPAPASPQPVLPPVRALLSPRSTASLSRPLRAPPSLILSPRS